MIIWTIQHEDAYKQSKETGVLRANSSYIRCDGDRKRLYAYRWMAEQMKSMIGESPCGVEYPVWGWYKWNGLRKPPDMRCSGHAPKGTPVVRVTADVPKNVVLLSDFVLFHYVLNQIYIAKSQEDSDRFSRYLLRIGKSVDDLFDLRQQSKDLECLRHEIESGWDLVFNLDDSLPSYLIQEPRVLQATMWEINENQIIKVEYFTAK